ncbi:prepilin-type N-terminal cleavage/methylation domain-containing protein [Gilvimarinus agarilyticus]|uniref:prepilin-type N-terminal cleavage/methylation domain-containing protein n=1 Tax=Gilvimarinus sp. 2_MG-2023 TaxID=3062666 RepID=UPI001C0A66F8|nr:prepilin-type N-terminal cleavage/methylation domain-containing protein [Gilvimarinus sp. 2_MG-2023]MBU2887580.1 prepilin-type N-terminal cleavage/methylation domain-containing protein [Gilvimarinus agarilyticus]MDO6572231.1 prepilin-type N-terminal cleavage/methylation domain-containing protein [Gilvimarinus sp. 2_MG-2023]
MAVVARRGLLMLTRAKGFTLLELMVALSIAAILLAVSSPAVKAMFQGAQYRSSVGEIVRLLNAAKYESMTSGHFVDLKITPKSSQLSVAGREPLQLADHLTLEASVAEEYMQDASTGVIRFYPDATSTGGSVRLLRHDGSGVLIQVGWLLSDIHQYPISESL